MNVKLSNLVKIAVTLCCVLLLSTSCTKKEYYESDIHETQWKILEFKVNDWKWDSNSKNYTATYDLPELDKEIYNDGAVLGYIYLGKAGLDENMFPLPFEGFGASSAYEKISYDVSYDLDRTIRFSYEWSDRAERTPPTCNFKVVLIY